MERFMLVLILPIFFIFSSNPSQTINNVPAKKTLVGSSSCINFNSGGGNGFLMDYGMAEQECLCMDVCCGSKVRLGAKRKSLEESPLFDNSLLVLDREVAGYFIVPDGGLTP